MEVINGWLELEDGMWFFGFIFGVKMSVFGEVGRYVNVIKNVWLCIYVNIENCVFKFRLCGFYFFFYWLMIIIYKCL